MKSQSKRESAFTAILIIVALLITSILLIAFYSITKYISFLLVALLIIPFSLLNLIIIIISGSNKKIDSEAILSDMKSEEDSCEKRNQLHLNIVKRVINKVFEKIFFILQKSIMSCCKSKVIISIILFTIIEVIVQFVFWTYVPRMTSIYTLNYLYIVFLLIFFIVFIILDKFCLHALSNDKVITVVIDNLRSIVIISRFSLLLLMISVVIKLLGLYDLQKILVFTLIVVFCYVSVFIIVSFISVLIKKELFNNPEITIPIPFAVGNHKNFGVIAYLEKNTGITMRTLWSIQVVKIILPYTIIVSALLLWICTGIVQVESYQTAAVYRLGVLKESALAPGIHLTFPWPIDKIETIDTDQIKKITIGYNSVENTDNIWTGTHGVNEYKLLLGSGNELVSINLRVEYKISDIIAYLKNSASPEKILEVKAYEIVADRTINSNLETMLSVDRSAFSETFREELTKKIEGYNIGVEVVGVVLESIHPPTDVASVYQEIVGAEISAEKYIFDAEAEAATKIAGAEEQKNTSIAQANADNYTRVANAKADVAEFMASLDADNSYGDTYMYYKYLDAIGKAYGLSKVIIVGEGIDSSNLYFGNFSNMMIN